MSKGGALALDAGIRLRCSKLYNNNLSGGWLAQSVAVASPLSLSLSVSPSGRESVFVTVASVVYISGCSEDKTNGILHKYPSSSSAESLLAHTFLSFSRSASRSPPLFLFPKPALSERTAILARGCFVSGKREREREGETNTPLRDFASSFDDSKMGKSRLSDGLA